MNKVFQLSKKKVTKALAKLKGFGSSRKKVSKAARGFKLAKDGTKIFNFNPLNISDVLPSNHPRIREYHDGNIFHFKGYSALEVASFLKVQVENFPFSDTLRQTLISPIPATRNDAELLSLLRRWRELFDKWCFAGVMRGQYTLELQRTDPKDVGWYDPTSSTIFLNPNADPTLSDSTSRYSREEYLIQTLLHELVHCFIDLSCCRKKCCKVIYDNPSLGGPGEDGHGPVWADSMIVLTDALQKEITWNVPQLCGEDVARSMALHSWQPTVEQLMYWAMGFTRQEEEEMYWSDIEIWDKERLVHLRSFEEFRELKRREE